ncbi:MAG: 4-hydroxy-3-methylbut-2-enyl diphosphate reductase [Alphaproteobacteria bacterium]
MSQGPEEIVLAEPRGFCAGVDRAIEIVERALTKFGAPVYVRHEIVHNDHVVADLRSKGAVFIEDLNEVPLGSRVIMSAHGVARKVRAHADERSLQVFDATCPLVTKVHIEARRHADNNRHLLLIGHAGHPEVEGTMGQVNADQVTLIETVEDARTVQPPEDSNLAFATQTTLSVDDTAEIISVLQFRFPDITGPRGEDICYATTNRQKAVKDIASNVDLMLVIGASNSSNSQRLVEVAKQAGAADAMLIADTDAIAWERADKAGHIGLSAGASAPESLVQDVIQALTDRYDLTVTEHGHIRETVNFKLPSILTQ